MEKAKYNDEKKVCEIINIKMLREKNGRKNGQGWVNKFKAAK